jgi:2-oxoglutarate ferredoxin oxidoreductase subunit alpha
MTQRVLLTGNVAAAQGAIYAGCRHYFGYPITPQTDVVEFFARELPKLGGFFVQTESESTSINMLYGCACTGVRCMTSSSSTGFSLMMEGLSTIAAAEVPCVVMNVQRGGPGAGSTQTAQMDYMQAAKGGGHGGCKMIVLAPASVQECFDFVQLAFYLADKYRHPTMVLSDAMIGQMMESVELVTHDFGPVPEKPWVVSCGRKDGKRGSMIHNAPGIWSLYKDYQVRITEKYKKMAEHEVRCKTYEIEDADLIIVSFGSSARSSLGAYEKARSEGLKVGVIRPITIWPFPTGVIRGAADRTKHFLVVEDNLGQMVEDVDNAVQGKADVHFMGMLARHLPDSSGMIFPHAIYREVRKHI